MSLVCVIAPLPSSSFPLPPAVATTPSETFALVTSFSREGSPTSVHPQDSTSPFLASFLVLSNLCTQRGAPTHDLKMKGGPVYPLSQPGALAFFESCFCDFLHEPSMANLSQIANHTPSLAPLLPVPLLCFSFLFNIYSSLAYFVYGLFPFLECKFHEAVLFFVLSPLLGT